MPKPFTATPTPQGKTPDDKAKPPPVAAWSGAMIDEGTPPYLVGVSAPNPELVRQLALLADAPGSTEK
jgi:hypothetical protein